MKHSLFTRVLSLFLVVAMLIPSFPLAMAEEGETLPIVETTEATEAAETTEATQPSEDPQETIAITEPTQPDVTEPAETEAPTEPAETTVPSEPEETDPAAEPTEETTEPTEETTEPTEETEPEELPYGLTGLPEGYVLSDIHAEKREAMLEHNVLEDAATMTAGYDYVTDEILVEARSEEEAQLFAEAYNGSLISYDHELALIRLTDLTASEAVVLALDEETNLPVPSFNNIYHIEPMFSPAIATASVPAEQTWSDWVYETLDNPDPYLLKPAETTYQYMHDVVDSYAAWGVNTGRKAVTVGIIDSGVDTTHPDLSGVISVNVGQGTGDPDGHGTHVAGIVAATLNNGRGGSGIAPNVQLYAYRTANSSGGLVTSAIIDAIYDAGDRGLDVINMSLGGPSYNYSFQAAINYAYNQRVTVVVAMGNDGTNAKQYPAGYDNVIAVGATDRSNGRAYFSNFGAWCDVSAPGVDIMSTYPGGQYVLMDGTSMACPVVTGVCALYISWYGDPSPAQVEKALEAGCEKCADSGMGAGIVNIANMIDDKPKAPAYWIYNESGSTLYSNDGSEDPYKNQEVVCEGSVQLGTFGNDNEFYILYTLDGKAPSVKDGEIVCGTKYEAGTKIPLEPCAGGKLTLKAMQVSGLGIPGAVLTLNIKVADSYQVTGLTITGPKKLNSGKSAQFTATVAPAKADQTVTWSITRYTGSLSAAKINAKTGVLTTPAGGTGTITVKAVSNANSAKPATYTVTVEALTPVGKMELSAAKANTFVGKTLWLSVASTLDAKGNELDSSDYGYQWTSSNKKVATVDQNGKVTTIGKGSTTITCKVLDGSNKTAKCALTVQQQATSVEITGAQNAAAGGNITLKATVLPTTANNKKVSWSLAASVSGVTVDAKTGKVTVASYVSTGTAFTVVATAEDGAGAYDRVTIRVQPKVTKVEILPDENYKGLAAGEVWNNKGVLTTVNLFSANLPNSSGADNRIDLGAYITGPSSCAVSWTSNKPAVASVDQNGVVTAHAAGNVTITATALDGSKKKDTVSVKVTNPVSYMGIKTSAQQMTLPFPVCGFGKSVTNKVQFGDTYGKPSNTKVNWDFEVWVVDFPDDAQYWSDMVEVRNVTSTFKNNGKVTVKNGTLSVKANISSNWANLSGTEEYKVKVIARAADGSGATTVKEYLLMPLTTYITGLRKTITLDRDSSWNCSNVFQCNQWMPLGSGVAFTVTSSNPDVCWSDGVVINSRKTTGNYYIKCGLYITTGKPGTAKLTIKCNDGSNKSYTVTVKVQ